MQMAVITLQNGVRVSNLVEVQPLVLDTGEVLPPCDATTFHDWKACIQETSYHYHPWQDVEIKSYLSVPVRQMLFKLDWEEVDVVLVPPYVRRAVVDEYKRHSATAPFWLDAAYKKTRMAIVQDKETGAVFSNRFLM